MTLDATNTFLYALRLLARSNISCRWWYLAFFFVWNSGFMMSPAWTDGYERLVSSHQYAVEKAMPFCPESEEAAGECSLMMTAGIIQVF